MGGLAEDSDRYDLANYVQDRPASLRFLWAARGKVISVTVLSCGAGGRSTRRSPPLRGDGRWLRPVHAPAAADMTETSF